jgi:hypothetical protein
VFGRVCCASAKLGFHVFLNVFKCVFLSPLPKTKLLLSFVPLIYLYPQGLFFFFTFVSLYTSPEVTFCQERGIDSRVPDSQSKSLPRC